MIFTCIGHAEFLIELENGMRIVTDPYDKTCGYPVIKQQADVVLVSHGHHDHNAVENVKGASRIIDQAGEYDLGDGVTVIAVEACHDEAGGSKRGKTLLFSIRTEGLNAVHLGDLGHLPTREQCNQLGAADVLMVPVGGFYTIDASTAKAAAEALGARVVLPMHYKTRVNADWPIAKVDDFLALCDAPAEELDQLRVAKDDLMCQPKVAVLKPVSLK
ncbi:MAG: MBL fold metallo-hydrolase [Clostridia bacterium]|nr:MBL fold metallo-hydrolase [Clostridia bacterium]